MSFPSGGWAPNILGGLLMVLPQMILWKIATGDFLCYSYEGEAFTYLANPKLYEVFFSDAKGLLIFSPILIFSIIGLFFLGRVESGKYTAGIVAVFALETYTTAAWWCWWLGGVYSIRSFVDIFPFFAIAMAAFSDGFRSASGCGRGQCGLEWSFFTGRC